MTPNSQPPVQNLVDALLSDLSNVVLLTQGAIIVTALIVAWLGLRQFIRYLSEASRETWHADEWPRFLVPGLALLLILVARPLLAHYQSVHLLNLAVPMLLSMFIIQSTFFLLRTIANPGPGLRAVERVVSWMVWGAVALHITGHLGTLIAIADAIGFTIGKQHISLYTAVLGLISIATTVIVALSAGSLIEARLITGSQLDGNMKIVLNRAIRGMLLVIAILISLPLVGIDITVLSVFGGALGVGLGLGLQKIASNYVSGFTLLLENSLKIGDMVEAGDRYGMVTQIATRYTVLRALDGTETVIPNETLITSPVVNHSLSDTENRLFLPIQVAYGSDLDQVRAILLEIARAQPKVLPEPGPAVFLSNFGDNGINMELAIWINTPDEGERVLRSLINWEIWRRFKEANIEIPFPQRVVHIADKPV